MVFKFLVCKHVWGVEGCVRGREGSLTNYTLLTCQYRLLTGGFPANLEMFLSVTCEALWKEMFDLVITEERWLILVLLHPQSVSRGFACRYVTKPE